ncbi:MAG: hypothetical protein HZB22_04820 [Deltaproteobacteria bacterium]|nr:hypothetical protein [Deltaproteobacteria bacterium]
MDKSDARDRNAQTEAGMLSRLTTDALPVEYPQIKALRRHIEPLKLDVSGRFPKRINVLIGIIDFKYFFGGYISVFNLVKRLSREGYDMRAIVIDECTFLPVTWRDKLKDYEGLEDFFDYVEVVYAHDRDESIECNEDDVFLATSWWSAYVANAALERLRAKRFLYLTQDYEPIFYNMGPLYVLSRSSYDLPHCAIISTGILKEHYLQNGIGVFKAGADEGERRSVFFENAILKFDVDAGAMRARKKKRFLFYARPEAHAARNLFEIGMFALSLAVERGYFDLDNWEFYGIGTIGGAQNIAISDGVDLKLISKVSLNEYRELLPCFDAGMSLMLSPHPSLVPIEMCAAGMVVVTNTFANKTPERMKSISSNFAAAEPNVDAIALSLKEAASRADDFDARIKGTKVNWSQSWDESFDARFIGKIKSFIDDIGRPASGASSSPAAAAGAVSPA